MTTLALPELGQLVQVRSRPWVVNDVTASNLPTPAMKLPRVNLLIADDVGLGKTIEAGMVALELILRHRARKILVVCPSALQIQWRDQMRDKFGLDFRIVDSNMMRDLRRRRGHPRKSLVPFSSTHYQHRFSQARTAVAADAGNFASTRRASLSTQI